MANVNAERFRFIGHAYRGDGPFRPTVSYGSDEKPASVGETALVRYPRESDAKFAARNAVSYYVSPLASSVNRFCNYLFSQPVERDLLGIPLYAAVLDDADGKGNSLDIFLSDFAAEAKARGCMLLLVDMPPALPPTLGEQIAYRVAPYLTAIAPESVVDFEIGQDGKFDYVEFSGQWVSQEGERLACIWRFDRRGWLARSDSRDSAVLDAGEHPLGECPVIAFTEFGDFPCFGAFSALADLGRRMFNVQSELDEILRSQTFSLLTMQVPESATEEAKIAAAKTVGETIGTSNLLVHSGSSPSFIAPPDGPAKIYLDTLADLREQANEIGLQVVMSRGAETEMAARQRFRTLNSALAKFSGRLEDFERRIWSLVSRWLGMQSEPRIKWPRDFTVSDVETELSVLDRMQSVGMPLAVVTEQRKRVIAVYFAGADTDIIESMIKSVEEPMQERPAQRDTTVEAMNV